MEADEEAEVSACAVRVRARLRQKSFGSVPEEAMLGVMPLHCTREFAELTSFEQAGTGPVMLSPARRNTVLAEVASVLHTIATGPILVKFGGGDFRVSVPAELLRGHVLLCSQPKWLAERLLADGVRNIFCVWCDIRTDGFERGANGICISLHSADGSTRRSFAAAAREDALMRRFEDVRIAIYG